MAQQIYNEGRVTGFSAWEIFARDALDHGIDPNDIPDEHEWLLSMMSRGASLVLKVPGGTQKGIWECELPESSTLTGAGVIIGSPFIGNCEFSGNVATKVTSYGPLINNTSGSHPPANGSSVPYNTNYNPYVSAVTEFVKINDGIVYTKSAKWIRTTDGEPYEDIDPNFGNTISTVVRFYISEPIADNTDVYVLLTGFDNKSFLRAVSGWARDNGSGRAVGGSTDTDNNHWQNGGMLGPEIIPWASKIVLTVPNSAYTLTNTITRRIPSDTTYGDEEGDPINIGGFTIKNYLDYKLNTTPFIDFDSINLTDYYEVKHLSSATLRENVKDINLGFTASYNTLIAWYPGMSAAQIIASGESNAKFFPPALYATKVTAKGTQTLIPMDTAAPGTIKCFNTAEEAYNYTQILPNNFAIYYNSSNNTYSFVKKGDSNVNNWYSTAKIEYLEDEPRAKISTNATSAQFVSLTNPSGTPYNVTGNVGWIGAVYPKVLNWKMLLDALPQNASIDLLGSRLTTMANDLCANNNIGIASGDSINEIGATKLTINPGANGISITSTTTTGTTKLAALSSGTSIKSGTQFIELVNGLRLYISTTTPGTTDIPVGSIGIGW